jgi:hypothetical protein
MKLWYPPTDTPHLLEWWRPLLMASRAARAEEVPWPIHVDDFSLRGRIDRGSRPAIWVYRHPANGGELYLDPTGQPYTFVPTPRAKGPGRFQPIDLRTAIWRARLPDVVQPVFYESDIGPRRGGAVDDDDGDDDGAPAPPTPPTPRRRGHLVVIDGGAVAG